MPILKYNKMNMKNIINKTAFVTTTLALVAFTGCETTPDATSPSSSNTMPTAAPSISSSDVALCAQITQKIVSSSDRDELSLNTYYTPFFASLIKKGCASGEGEAPYLNYDFIGETQDDSPKPISIGPGKIVGNTIHVPFIQAHTNSAPFTKTWVFVNQNGKWLASDILTSGREQGNGSMVADLKRM
jgi:hypothetical protein